jgi:hypothetical protein
MKFIINAEKLLKEITPSAYFGIVQGNQPTTYSVMLKCVADDSGNILPEREARAAIDAMSNNSMAEFQQVQKNFIHALTDALVNPTSGNG